jgi:hypothetical protein
MGVTNTSLSSLYHISPEQLIARLRQLNNLQRELFFMETLGGIEVSSVLPGNSQPSFSSVFNRVINYSPSVKEANRNSSSKEFPQSETVEKTTSVNKDGLAESEIPGRPGQLDNDIGALSRRFESKADLLAGVGTIGYDANGGTSYGIYQISSRQGSMDQFLKFLETRRPDWASRLRSAGNPNTGGVDGAFPREWKAIASEAPEEFAALQHEFIRERYFEPACAMIKSETGIDIHSEPKILQEMVWSMAVQHGVGGAVSIFKQALKEVSMGETQTFEVPKEDIIERVYAIRSKKFASSSSRIRQAVIRRFEQEKSLVLAGLENTKQERFSQWS